MAKSLRSKWKRRMRAAKRERYGQKELDRLKNMLGINGTDVEMKEENLEDIAIVKTAAEVVSEAKEAAEPIEVMDDDRPIYNKKTLKDQHGKYPVWLGSRKLKKVIKKNKSTKRNKKTKKKTT